MFIGSASDRGHVYTPHSGQGEPAVAKAPEVSKESAAPPDGIPLINPAINYDYQSGIAVLEIRDPKSGEVEVQYPSKKVVQEYIRQGAASKDAPQPVALPDRAAAPPAVESAPASGPTGSPAQASSAAPEPAHTRQTA